MLPVNNPEGRPGRPEGRAGLIADSLERVRLVGASVPVLDLDTIVVWEPNLIASVPTGGLA
jgi:hypothetical protein